MTLPLPSLDDRRFTDLVQEAKSLIPAYQADWTDYNPSDPGITLIELFAWLAEMLIYRADQVPESHVRAFLRLLDPNADAIATGDLDADVTRTIKALRAEYRAVTAADYEAHATAIPGVARARCVPLRDLSPSAESARLVPKPAYVSVIVVPQPGAVTDTAALVSAVANDLGPRRLITTRLAVVEPIRTPVAVRVLVARPSDVLGSEVLGPINSACTALLDPVRGGTTGTGWPFGRPVYVAELIAAIEGVADVDHVADVDLSSTCQPAAARCVEAEPLIADDGLLIGMRLGQEALPELSGSVTVASSAQFVPVTVQVNAMAAPEVTDSTRPAVLRAVSRAVSDLAWPPADWPAGGTPPTIDTGTVTGAAGHVEGIAAVTSVTLTADPARLRTATSGIVTVTLGPLELAELTVNVTLGPAA
jgi:hypothetical protein